MAKAKKSKAAKIIPLHDRVVVKREEAESTTSGGIVLPDAATTKPLRGEVVAIGEGYTNDKGVRHPLSVAVGNVVLFGPYAGDEIQVGDEDYLLMRESDILAVC